MRVRIPPRVRLQWHAVAPVAEVTDYVAPPLSYARGGLGAPLCHGGDDGRPYPCSSTDERHTTDVEICRFDSCHGYAGEQISSARQFLQAQRWPGTADLAS